MQPKQMRGFCQIPAACHALLKHAMEDLHPSGRAHDRILKVARTIADLAKAGDIGEDHLPEALQDRSPDR